MMGRFFIILASALMGAVLSNSSFALSPQEEPAVQVIQKIRPAVVNIYTERLVTRTVVDPADLFFERFFGGGIARGNRIVQTPIRNLGSGLLVSENGYIVTNHHVAERAEDLKIKVTLSNGTEDYEAKLIRDDPDLDLSLIKIQRDEPFPFYDIEQLSPNLLGQTVLAIGNPVGYESSVSRGILSAKERTLNLGGLTMEGLLQTDAAINPGNSGGPLVDLEGKLVGLNTAKMAVASNIPVENIGFAVPGERVQAFVQDAIAIAKGEKPAPPEIPLTDILQKRLGLIVQDLTPELAAAFGYNAGQGLLISDVRKGSPAENAGIRQGMLLIGLGARRIHESNDLPRDLQRLKTGDSIRVTLLVLRRQGNYVIQRTAGVILTAG